MPPSERSSQATSSLSTDNLPPRRGKSPRLLRRSLSTPSTASYSQRTVRVFPSLSPQTQFILLSKQHCPSSLSASQHLRVSPCCKCICTRSVSRAFKQLFFLLAASSHHPCTPKRRLLRRSTLRPSVRLRDTSPRRTQRTLSSSPFTKSCHSGRTFALLAFLTPVYGE